MEHPLLLCCFLLLTSSLWHCATSDDTGSQLLKGINGYRATQKVPALSENKNAACLAEQLAKQFKGQQCTNSTGSDTVPGTEVQFPNYPQYLDHCHLNATVTQDGEVMPACVPGLVPGLVLTNYTKSQYNQYLNDSKFAGIGIADEGDWVVVVLSTNTPTGGYAPAPPGSNWASSISPCHQLVLLLLGFVILLMK